MHTHKYTCESHVHVICVHTYVNMPVRYKLFLVPLPDLSQKQADMPGSSFHPMYVSYRMSEVWVSGTLEAVCLGSLSYMSWFEQVTILLCAPVFLSSQWT